MTPNVKQHKNSRNKTPDSNLYNKNLRSSVGECLSWEDPGEDSAKPARSLPRSRQNPELEPRRLFSRSFAEKPPMNPLDPPYHKTKVHFLDQPIEQNQAHLINTYVQRDEQQNQQPSQKSMNNRSHSHQERNQPVFADHLMDLTSLELPSETYSREEKIEMQTFERNICQLRAEQIKVIVIK